MNKDDHLQASRPLPPLTLEIKWPGEDEEELVCQSMAELHEKVATIRRQSTFDNSARLLAWDKNGNPVKV